MHPITLEPIGTVRSPVLEPLDDVWGGVQSQILLDHERFTPDALLGLTDYSHIEVIFHFDKIAPSDVYYGARHPRGRQDWPLSGIFAQRAKNRPNRLGVTVCRLLSVEGLTITVEELDAIDGTPVLDIKPYIIGFQAKGEVRQPRWASELMETYWS